MIRIVNLPKRVSKFSNLGTLVFLEAKRDLPFAFKRAYLIHGSNWMILLKAYILVQEFGTQ